MILKLLVVLAIMGYIVWEIVKLNRDPELRADRTLEHDNDDGRPSG